MLKINPLFTLIFVLVLSIFTLTAVAGETLTITQQALLSELDKPDNNIVLLDVRSAKEYNQGHIAGAINVSYDNVESQLAQLTKYQQSKVVVYCRSGRRAGIAEQVLAENGFSHLRHLTGDMNGWQAANLPVVVEKLKQ